ncbi:MAG: GTPase ObgE [Gammaproteobacteria bacterium]|nr:GTPase ObgE [Gammaproteobacteria bacterium]MCY4323569.1 GTPase ObgE [Gammaproteobacteria bacterium]
MRFVDEAVIEVAAGHGGHGCLSFRREKFVERGGPDGGDGGNGGDIYLVASEALNTLVDFRYTPSYAAASGESGAGRQRTGARGNDLRIPVPCGTRISDEDTGEAIGDLTENASELLVATGGRRGLGNTRFKSSTNRAPRRTTRGKPGEARRLHLELRLMADAGLLGAPNAGKSSFLARISDATPKVADYPFTTLEPCLGVVRLGHAQSFVVADIPGLIEGSHKGAGLGLKFLRHLSRTRMLLHLVDVLESPLAKVETIENELVAYGDEFHDVPIWLVFNKIDLLADAARAELAHRASRAFPARRQFFISSASGEGVSSLLFAVSEVLESSEGNRSADEEDAIAKADLLKSTSR